MRKPAIYYLVKKAGLTQKELSKKLNISRTGLNFILNGTRQPTDYQLAALQQFFGKDESELFERKSPLDIL